MGQAGKPRRERPPAELRHAMPRPPQPGQRTRSLSAVKTTFEGAVRHEVRHWLACSMVERVSAVEIIRRATWGIYGDAAPARLVRVSERIEAPWRPVPARRRARPRRPRSAARD